ncbi:MAG: 30S ribosomal protein S17 [Oceanipulchritudo sp.]
MSERKKRSTIIGTVTNRSGDKSIKVTYDFKVRHRLYKKEIKQKTVVNAHDEKNECSVGDRVSIMETRPISKLKRFRVVSVLEKAPVIG